MYTLFNTFAQKRKKSKKDVDKTLQCVYSSQCSAVEASAKAKERVPCKLNNEEKTKAPESGIRKDAGKKLASLRLSQLLKGAGKRNEAMTNSSIKD